MISFPVRLALLICSLVIYFPTIYLTVNPRFHFKTRKILKQIGLASCILFSSIALIRDFLTTISVILFYGGMTATIMMNKMTRRYIDLVERKMTLKEEVARRKACKTYHMQDDFKLPDKISASNKRKNVYRFLFTRKTPKSMLKDCIYIKK